MSRPTAFRPQRLAVVLLSQQHALVGFDRAGHGSRGADAIRGAAARCRRESSYWAAASSASSSSAALAADYLAAAALLEERAARASGEGGGVVSVPSIPVSEIRANPRNPRRDVGDVAELAASIRAVGLLQPLLVTQVRGGWMIIDGHRRLAAAKLASREAVPCVAIKPGDTGRDTALALAAAMHKQLAPLERAAAFKQLRDEQGLTVVEIAQRTGYAARTVSESLRLLLLPPEAQRMLAGHELTVAEATDLARQVAARGAGEVARGHRNGTKARHLDGDHPLADRVRAMCTHRDSQVVIGAVGCGRCWEDTIRADERALASVGVS